MSIKVQLIYILIIKMTIVCGLTCDEALEFPEKKKFSLKELESMLPKDVAQCVAHLGKSPIPLIEAELIWNSIKQFYEDVSLVPDEVLMLLKWITIAVTPDDYNNMTLHDIDVIQNFGQDYGLDEEQRAAIAYRVRKDFSSKEPEDYTNFDLIAMNQILCSYNKSDIERIHPIAYKDAAFEIGNLIKCSDEAMSAFATLAVHVDAFGPVESWNEDTIKVVGKVGNYLPQEYLSKFHISRHRHRG